MLSAVALLYYFLLLEDTEASLLEPRKRCVPTSTVTGPCHLCVCTVEGLFHCRSRTCQEDKKINVSQWRLDQLPSIKDGQSCINGKTYRMDCNTCRCGPNNSLLCTKMACLDIIEMRKPSQNYKRMQTKPVARLKLKRRRVYKKLPQGPCTPGKYYTKRCNKCYCTDKMLGVCSKKRNACGLIKYQLVKRPDDVMPPLNEDEFTSLPSLQHSAATCEPGKTYRVNCNVCLCLANKNLLCDTMLCFSPVDMRRIATIKLQGKRCNGTVESNCVRCVCNAKKNFDCKPIDKCITETERRVAEAAKVGKNVTRISLSQRKEECIPDAIYRDNCNKCYCQSDKTLRCTLKTCLNYNQVVKLEKQWAYLSKQGR